MPLMQPVQYVLVLSLQVYIIFQVSMLHKMLQQEKNFHEFLDQLQHRKDDSLVSIPAYLPPKVKEILSELVMVENEITRLENQISNLQTDITQEKELTKEFSKSKHDRNFDPPRVATSLPPLPKHANKGLNGKTSPEKRNQKVDFEPSKGLLFISKAIKGDYNLSDFKISDKQINSNAFSDLKENQFHEHIVNFREKNLKKSALLKSSSPLRDARRPTPAPSRRERNSETSQNLPVKYVSTPTHTEEEDIEKWPPNKLSENIMKCLTFIFVRLLRTTRAIELERSGPILRSTNFSMSFRAESCSNSKASLMLQKDSKQQDPYGIFELEESIPRDIGPYKNLVRFTSSSMDAKCISSSNSTPLFQRLKLLIKYLQQVELRSLTNQQKLAFWINIYNACIMNGFLLYGVPSDSSPEKLLTLMNKTTLNVGGNTVNAPTIEQFILRKPSSLLVKDSKTATIHEVYGIEISDPNVTFALCCGTRSSPAVRIYTAEGVKGELEKSKLEYLQASIVVTSTKRVALPELLLRNMQDFAKDTGTLVEWVCHQLPTSGTLRKSMVDCFRGTMGGKISTIIEKIPYEFEFQYLLSI
ncbi:hypothetical protein Leryth_026493 [Lithospermum erythrorhizon]|nr:hypothetical protein Leryth_026493 [Lithospermum erythrorhizon]